VIAEGATTINIPDTVGYAVPELYGKFIRNLRERIPNSDKAVWSVHCHNDLGMAVANSLAGVKIGGARQVECTINGLGERAGNCSLEEVVMAVKTRRDYFGLDLASTPRRSCRPSRMVSQTTGFVVQPNKAVVGANAFAHASRHPPGRRAEGARHLRDHARRGRGLERQQDRAGQAVGAQRLQAAAAGTGHRDGLEADINAAFARFKDLADRKSEIFDEDIIALVGDESVTSEQEHYRLLSLAQQSETGERPARAWHSRPVRSSTMPKRRQRTGGCQPEGDRVEGAKRRRAGALFGQRHHFRQHRVARRGHGAAAAGWARGQRRRGRPGHRCRLRQGLPRGAEQAALHRGTGGGTGLIGGVCCITATASEAPSAKLEEDVASF
jgi:hypothetical protein